jgi:hypothetical protein
MIDCRQSFRDNPCTRAKPANATQISILLALLISACNPAAPSPIATTTVEPVRTATYTPSTTVVTATSTPDYAYFVQTTAIVQAVLAAAQPRLYASYPSPDKRWRADILLYDCVRVQASANADENAYEELRLVQADTASEAIIDSQLQNCGGVGAYGLGGLFWSPNSRYFYYIDAREGVPDGLCGYWTAPIQRVDIVTQRVEPVGGGQLSPDKTRLAIWQGVEIVIWRLDDGEMARIPARLRAAFPGAIAWSPDGQSLAYLQTELDCLPYGKSSVTRLHLADQAQDLLFESEAHGFGGLTWDAPYRITLVDDQGNRWRYNLESRELRPVP